MLRATRSLPIPGRNLAVGLALITASAVPALACPGDCDGNGRVGVNEVVRGVAIVLGESTLELCPSFDGDGDGIVSISELLRAVNAILVGCPPTPTVTASSTSSSTPSSTDTPTAPPATTVPSDTPTTTATPLDTPSPTPTATLNQPPRAALMSIYRTYPGFPVQVPVAVDPEGGAVQCGADTLPDGASYADDVLSWTPTTAQLGPLNVPFVCSDTAEPPAAAPVGLIFKVQPLDACITPTCDPAVGCTVTLPPPSQHCCASAEIPRIAEPAAGCPEGRVAFIGRNISGFGRLQDCDVLRVRNFAQSGAQVNLHVAARCFDTSTYVEVAVRIETAHRLLVNAIAPVLFQDFDNGYAIKRNLAFDVMGGGPFFDITEDGEANVVVTVTDSDNNSATTRLRLQLSFDRPDDLPDVDPTPTPTTAPQ